MNAQHTFVEFVLFSRASCSSAAFCRRSTAIDSWMSRNRSYYSASQVGVQQLQSLAHTRRGRNKFTTASHTFRLRRRTVIRRCKCIVPLVGVRAIVCCIQLEVPNAALHRFICARCEFRSKNQISCTLHIRKKYRCISVAFGDSREGARSHLIRILLSRCIRLVRRIPVAATQRHKSLDLPLRLVRA